MSLFGISAFILNFLMIYSARKYNFLQIILMPEIYITFSISLVVVFTRAINNIAIRIMHVGILLLISIIGIFDSYTSFYGLGFFCLAIVLSFKYGFLNVYPKVKLLISGIIISSIVELSVNINKVQKAGLGVSVILFISIFITLLYTIYKSDIDSIQSSKKELEKNLSQLLAERSQLESHLSEQKQVLKEYELQIKKALVEETGNLEKFRETYGLTKKEMEVLIIVYETGKTNQEIAEDLHIAVGTVKQHLSRSYTKLDVRNRTQMQAMLREFRTTGILPETMPKHEVLI